MLCIARNKKFQFTKSLFDKNRTQDSIKWHIPHEKDDLDES